MERWRQEWPETKKAIIARILAEPNVECGIESAMQGKSAVQELLRDERLVASKIVQVEIDKDKVQRVNMWSPRAESGKVVLVAGNWIPAFLSEAEVFDGKSATYDDQVDAVSGCVQMLAIPKWRETKFLQV
jgi:predicted phage terminase large subunit-like protein